MSIKMYGLIPRKPGMTYGEFHDHYCHPHGTMGRNMVTMRGYVQNHQIDTDRLGPDQRRFDAVAEIWMDNEKDIAKFCEDPILVRLLEDEPKCVDMPKLQFFAANSEVLTSGPALDAGLYSGDEMWSPANRPLSIKLLHFIAADGSPDWARDDDDVLGLRLSAFHHTRARPLASVHGDAPPFLGLQEIWWPKRTAFHRAVAAALDALAELLARAGKSLTMLVQPERFS